ncbi:MAG: AraC family ligand binding domain-containing protein, partial [Candidatus Rokuibacteriota bacterium]
MRGRAPVGGVELLRAWFSGRAYARHRHDTYAIGVTEAGVQVFDYRGRVERSTPGPSNMLLTATGAAVGVRRGLPCLLGVALGMGLMMFVVAFGLGRVI